MGDYKDRVVTVDVLFLNGQDQLLMVKRGRDPGKGLWALPGGYLDWDERVVEGALRELAEETGLELKDPQMLGWYDDPDRHPEQHIAVAFWGRGTGTPKPGDDAELAEFFPLDDLPNHIAFDHAAMIADLKQLLNVTS